MSVEPVGSGVSALKPWRDALLVFGQPKLGQAERDAVLECLDSAWIGTGPRVAAFEADFARYVGAAHAVATSSCTAALYLALRTLDAPPGAEVITSSMTFCASANAIVLAGLRPVFVDCDASSMNITPEAVEAKIGPRTVAVLPVHHSGRPFDVRGMASLCARRGLAMIEDAAHAIEATVGGRHAGTFGRFGCFSFYANKNLTTGEGGMFVTDDANAAKRVRHLSMNGIERPIWQRFSEGQISSSAYDVVEPSLKLCMNDIAAAIGRCQLARIEERHVQRRRLWDFYGEALASLPLILPAHALDGERHAHHLFACRVDPQRTRITRDALIHGLKTLRIGTGIHYPAVHLLSYYREAMGARPGDLPVTESIASHTFSIPLSAHVTTDDAKDVVRALRTVFEHG